MRYARPHGTGCWTMSECEDCGSHLAHDWTKEVCFVCAKARLATFKQERWRLCLVPDRVHKDDPYLMALLDRQEEWRSAIGSYSQILAFEVNHHYETPDWHTGSVKVLIEVAPPGGPGPSHQEKSIKLAEFCARFRPLVRRSAWERLVYEKS